METECTSPEEEAMRGAKIIHILASTRYPIVSAYEFEFLKEEAIIRERMKDCTLYLILQRPLTYMTNLHADAEGIEFDIVDDHQPPLHCYLPLVENRIAAPGETTELRVLFLKNTPDTQAPFNDVAGFQILREDGSFVVWYSPHKFLYELLAGSLKAAIDSDPRRFLDFKVHYIGQAFSQKVWKRLTGHHKLQKVLTVEGPVSEKRDNRVAWEVALAMLSIDGFDEFNMFPVEDWMDLGEAEPILHEVRTGADLERVFTPLLGTRAPELTNEVEAMLISQFKPTYNSVLYDKYPEIANGTRSAGYTDSKLILSKMPVTLYTDAHRTHAVT